MPDYFEVADCLVNLGGDVLNSVPKYKMTAGEIAVLQVIHGKDAVNEIKPLGKIERTQRTERTRLKAIYGGAKDSQGTSLVEGLYPGGAARIFEKLEELELDDSQFAAIRVGRGSRERQAAAQVDNEKGLHLAAIDTSEIIPFAEGEEPMASGASGEGEDLDDIGADDLVPEAAGADGAVPPVSAVESGKPAGDDAFA